MIEQQNVNSITPTLSHSMSAKHKWGVSEHFQWYSSRKVRFLIESGWKHSKWWMGNCYVKQCGSGLFAWEGKLLAVRAFTISMNIVGCPSIYDFDEYYWLSGHLHFWWKLAAQAFTIPKKLLATRVVKIFVFSVDLVCKEELNIMLKVSEF